MTDTIPYLLGVAALSAIVLTAAAASGQLSASDEALAVEAVRLGDPAPIEVPALVPADEALRASAQVTRGDGWTAVAMRDGDLGVFVQGNARLVERPGLSAELEGAAQLGDAPALTRNEGTVHVAFWRGAIAYTLMVECASPFGDVRCTGDDFALALVASLSEVQAP